MKYVLINYDRGTTIKCNKLVTDTKLSQYSFSSNSCFYLYECMILFLISLLLKLQDESTVVRGECDMWSNTLPGLAHIAIFSKYIPL